MMYQLEGVCVMIAVLNGIIRKLRKKTYLIDYIPESKPNFINLKCGDKITLTLYDKSGSSRKILIEFVSFNKKNELFLVISDNE